MFVFCCKAWVLNNLFLKTELLYLFFTILNSFQTLNQKIEILANENTRLEEKVKKRSLAIQGFVYKSYKEKEMLPGDLKNIVISAAQAAKKNNKDSVAVAVKSFTSALKNVICNFFLNYYLNNE